MTQFRTIWSMLLVFAIPASAFGHAILKDNSDVPPRVSGQGQGGGKDIKTAPCAGTTRGNSPKVFKAGQTITLRINEYINHPGSFIVYFSAANDSNWIELAKIPDNINNGDKDISVTLPETPCNECTIRFVQEMTDRNPPTYYHDCGDIKITTKDGQPAPETSSSDCKTAGN